MLLRATMMLLLATAALWTLADVAAQSPTPAPTPTTTPVPEEPEFNYDIIKEVVAPLIGDDGRTHYVTLTEDTNGVVRVRLSFFSFPAGTYNVIVRASAQCGDEGGLVGQLTRTPLVWTDELASNLVLQFYNTRLLSLSPGAAGSIFDGDGAAIAIYRPGSGGGGLQAACARLGVPPGPPGTGAGMAANDGDDRGGTAVVAIGALLVVSSVAVVWLGRRSTAPVCCRR